MSLEENIGYCFSNREFLKRALRRKAYAIEQTQKGYNCDDQEIYRTLGDAVLKLAIIDLLIQQGSKTRDEITCKKKEMEREAALARLSEGFHIGAFIKLGSGEKKQSLDKEPKVLAETLEAIVGAIYLDAGYEDAKKVIFRWFER